MSDRSSVVSQLWRPARSGHGPGRRSAFIGAALLLALGGCATRSDYSAIHHAEQGDFDAALADARVANGGGVRGFLLQTGASQCRDYNAVVMLLVAKGDFAGARSACADYENECAVVSGNRLCFSYGLDELETAKGDSDMAASLTAEAREALHFRWLMIRDDYEGRPLKRPIY